MTCAGCAQRTRADLGRPCSSCGAVGVAFLDGYLNLPPAVDPWQTVPWDPQARGDEITGRMLRAVRLAAAAVLVRGLTAEQLQARPRWNELSLGAVLVRTAVRWGPRSVKRKQPEADPVPALLESLIASLDALRAVLLEQLTARASAEAEGWIGQRDSPIPPRVFTRLCRDLCARSDPRAAVRGRVHYLRQAAIDEWLQGEPGARRTPSELTRQNNATKLAQLGREFDAAMREPETSAEKWRRTLRAEGLLPRK